MRLLGLEKTSFSNWCEKFPGGTTIVVQPKLKLIKIDGSPKNFT